MEVIDVDKNIAENVISYRKIKKRKIKLPDAIILATAKSLGADLLSDDWDDFIDIDEDVKILNIDSLRK